VCTYTCRHENTAIQEPVLEIPCASLRADYSDTLQASQDFFFLGANQGELKMWKEMEGRWKVFRGEALKRWRKVTEQDLIECAGNRDLMQVRLQRIYGLSAEEAGVEIRSIERAVHDTEYLDQPICGGAKQ